MKLQTLQALVAIEESGSIRAAAKRLHMSQSSLTAAVQALEDELRAPLLVRSPKGIVLTSYGQAFMRYARLITAQSQRAKEEMAQMRGRWEGAIRFATSPALALHVLPRALRAFTQKYPAIRIECRDGLYPGVTPALRDGTLDFAISPIHRYHVEPDLAVEPLFMADVVIACSRSHPLSRAKTLAALAECEWIISSGPRGPGAIIEEAFAASGLPPPKIGMVCESFLALPGILAKSNWMATLPRVLFEHSSQHSALCIVEVAEAIPQATVNVLHRHDLPLTPAARELVQWLQHLALQRSAQA